MKTRIAPFILSLFLTVLLPYAAFASPAFSEIWGYLLSGDEKSLVPEASVTDIAYFGAGMNAYGALVGVPTRSRIKDRNGRVHLVVAETSNQALTHFCIDPRFGIRDALVESIAAAAAPYDGVQIDFEAVPPADAANFRDFLMELSRAMLRYGTEKTLSVALPARTRKIVDPYEYGSISAVVDRVIVMAYDEHWSGSAPGPIASLAWCGRVATYARDVIGAEKLVMGIPFYGRAWGDVNPSKAYKFSSLGNLMADKGIAEINRTEGIPWFEYVETVRVKVFFEDSRSVIERAALYRERGISGLSFWRLGQEDPEIWSALKTSGNLAVKY